MKNSVLRVSTMILFFVSPFLTANLPVCLTSGGHIHFSTCLPDTLQYGTPPAFSTRTRLVPVYFLRCPLSFGDFKVLVGRINASSVLRHVRSLDKAEAFSAGKMVPSVLPMCEVTRDGWGVHFDWVGLQSRPSRRNSNHGHRGGIRKRRWSVTRKSEREALE